MPAADDVPTDDPLRPTACPRCEYDLTGLPQPGTCPECGRAYGPPEVCLYGWGTGGTADPFGRARPSLPVRGLWWLGRLALLTFFVTTSGGRRSSLLLWAVPVLLIGAGRLAWHLCVHRATGPSRVRLGADGVSLGTRSLASPVPFEAADAAEPTPWWKVRRVVVKPRSGGRVRLTFAVTGHWWTLRTRYVDAIVRCPPAAVPALRARVGVWRAAATAAHERRWTP